MPARSRILLTVGALLALATAGVCAARLAVAGTASFDGLVARNDVEGGGRAELTGQALEDVRDALSIDPYDPVLHELVAFADSAAPRNPEEADAHFRRSIDLRPVSPYAWAAFAAERYRAGDTGPVFEKALVNAAMLGPSEAPVQSTVSNFGLAVWSESGAPTRRAVEAMLASGIQRYAPEFMQIAERRGRLDVACRHFDGFSRLANPKWIEPCNRLEATL